MLERDQRVAGETAARQRAFAGERMTGAHRDRELLTEELKPLHLRREPLLERERHVESASVEHLERPLPGALAQADLDAGPLSRGWPGLGVQSTPRER